MDEKEVRVAVVSAITGHSTAVCMCVCVEV